MRCSAALWAMILAIGCGERTHDGTQIGDEGQETGCHAVSETPLADLSAIPSGWTESPADLLAGLEEPRAGALSTGATSSAGEGDTAAPVEGGTEHAATIQGSYDPSGAMWVEAEDEAGLACPPYVSVPGTVTFTSDAITLTASGIWEFDGDNPPALSGEVPAAETSGSLEPPFEAAEGDEVAVVLWAIFADSQWSGYLSWSFIPASGSYAQEEPLGQFTAE